MPNTKWLWTVVGFGLVILIAVALYPSNVQQVDTPERVLLNRLKSIFQIEGDSADYFRQYEDGFDTRLGIPARFRGEGIVEFVIPQNPNRICDVHIDTHYYQVPCRYDEWHYQIQPTEDLEFKFPVTFEVYEVALARQYGYEWNGYEMWINDGVWIFKNNALHDVRISSFPK